MERNWMILCTKVTTSRLPVKNGILLKISETILVRRRVCSITHTAGVKPAKPQPDSTRQSEPLNLWSWQFTEATVFTYKGCQRILGNSWCPTFNCMRIANEDDPIRTVSPPFRSRYPFLRPLIIPCEFLLLFCFAP